MAGHARRIRADSEALRHSHPMSEEAIKHLSRADEVLERLIKRVGPCAWKPNKRRSPFETLVQSVAHQQLNGIAAQTILRRVKALYPGSRFPTPEELLD